MNEQEKGIADYLFDMGYNVDVKAKCISVPQEEELKRPSIRRLKDQYGWTVQIEIT